MTYYQTAGELKRVIGSERVPVDQSGGLLHNRRGRRLQQKGRRIFFDLLENPISVRTRYVAFTLSPADRRSTLDQGDVQNDDLDTIEVFRTGL